MNNKYAYLEQKGVQGLLTLFFILCAVYVVILISIVFSVIERKQNTLAVANLTNDLMQVENSYAGTLSTLTDATLLEKGYHKFDGAQFAVRKDGVATYALLYAK